MKKFRRLWLNLPLRRKGLIVTAIPVTALVVFSVSFLVVQRGYTNAGHLLRTALEVYGSTQKIHTSILEQDKSLRGYALAAGREYLSAYQTAAKQNQETLTQLRSTFRAQPDQIGHIDTILQLADKRRGAAQSFITEIEKAAGHDVGGPASRLWLTQNRALSEQIDGEVAAMQNGIKRELTADTRAVARAIILSDITVLASIAVGLIGGILAMILFASGIVRRIAELQKHAAGLARGEMPETEASSDEIGKVGVALRETASLLRRQTVDLQQRAEALAESEAANQKQTRLLECILNSMADGVMVADQAGQLVLCNPAARTLLGGDALDADLANLRQAVSIYRADTMTPCPDEELPLTRAIRGENPGNMSLMLRHHGTGEEVWVDATARPLRRADDVTRGGVSVFRDVSAAKKIEETLRQARAEAEQANHAKSEFLSRMSHELRTPMNAILGFAQLLDLDELTVPQRQSVDQILKGGRHLLTLINEVLDLARIEAGKMTLSIEPIPVGDAVQAAVDLLTPLAHQHRIVFRRIESEDWSRYVLADRQRFQQVVLNLLSNAIKYNQPGGSVTMTSRIQNGHFCLAIRDTGDGLAPEKMQNLFQPFERLGADLSAIEGTGIGLALSQRLMTAMGGSIGAQSELGIGSTFWAELPLGECPLAAYPEQEDEDSGKEPAAVAGAKTMKLLYIEDNLSNNLLMERILQGRQDIQLISTMQGRLGLELASQHNPDLIFLDLHLPDMTGDEVLRLLRNRRTTARTPVAMISADATPSQIERLRAAGANEYFTKPLDVRKLLQYVDEVLGVGV